MKLYRGVIEDNQDPLKCGRVRVRIAGLHTENNEYSGEPFNFIKTSDLPWAEVMGGTAFGLVGGIGLSSILRQGTWVWVILEEDDPNKPVVTGTIAGIPQTKKIYQSGTGFCDPDAVHPRTVGISDMNILTSPKYGDLAVLETESGHRIEIDDGVGQESIKITHKNGTSYLEMDALGNITLDAGIGNVTIKGTRIDLNP